MALGVAAVASYPLRSSALLNAFWIPLAFQEAALLAIAVPAALLRLSPGDYTKVLSVMASLAAAVSMVAPPFAGAISDYIRRRGGARRAIILAGAAVDVVCLLLAAHAQSALMLGVYFLLATLGVTASTTAYQALLPDTVPREAWGTVSGLRGAANLGGTVIGLGIAAATNPEITFTATAIFVAAGALTLFAVHERNGVSGDDDRATVRDWHDFIVVFISRLFIGFGLSLLMTYILYFMHDVFKSQNASAGTGLVAGCSLLGAIASSVWLGRLSDRYVRKSIVALSGLPMALSAFGFALAPSQHWIFIFAFIFGLGYGGVFSTGWALAIDSVPKLRDAARDLGIWGLASNLPAVVAPALGGWLFATLGNTTFAYQLLFVAGGCSFALGSLAVLAVRGDPARQPAR